MKTRILNSTRTPFASAKSTSRAGAIVRRFNSGLGSSLVPAPRFALPLGSLWDPTLLDRLHLPLTRHHE
jgi:hypothetical protein